MLDEITSFAGSGAVLKIFSGTQPSGGGSETTQLAELSISGAFAGSAAAGVLTLNSVTGEDAALASGTATWFRIETSGGTFVMDGDISTTSAGTGDMQLDDVAIVVNGTVSLSGPNTISAPNAP